MIRARIRRGVAFIAPFALIGCDRTYTASDYATRAIDPVPEWTMHVVVPTYADAMSTWQLSPGSPWAAYEKMTLLSALGDEPADWELPDVASMPDVQAASLAGRRMATTGAPPDAAVFVDLRGAASVAFARAYNQGSANRMALVPTFNNWPHDDELVPAEDALAAMVTMTPPTALDPAAHPMFLLDGWRLAYKDEEIEEDAFDNRYSLNAADLPSSAALLAQGIRRIVYVVEGTGQSAQEEDDLNQLFLDYEANGIEIAIVGIDDLIGVPEGWAWDEGTISGGESIDLGWWPRWRCRVHSRELVIHTPSFFGRSQGGWGGMHGFVGSHGFGGSAGLGGFHSGFGGGSHGGFGGGFHGGFGG